MFKLRQKSCQNIEKGRELNEYSQECTYFCFLMLRNMTLLCLISFMHSVWKDNGFLCKNSKYLNGISFGNEIIFQEGTKEISFL